MGRVKLLLIFVFALGSYFAWSKISSSNGEQKVSYLPSKKECYSGQNKERPWRFCIHVPAKALPNGNLAYLLHGRNLDENSWNDDSFHTAMIQQYWAEHKLSPPTVVTVSFGPVWLLLPRGKAAKSGLLDVFTNEVISEVEARTGKPKQRFVFGESMGGVNSLILGLSHPRLFDRVASLCPVIYTGSPFDSLAQIRDFIHRSGADPKVIFGVMKLSKDYFANEEEWNESSPLRMVEKVDPKGGPKIYLSCGLYDKYGNYEGAEHLARRAVERGMKLSWRPLYGGHCAMDIASLADFLAK